MRGAGGCSAALRNEGRVTGLSAGFNDECQVIPESISSRTGRSPSFVRTVHSRYAVSHVRNMTFLQRALGPNDGGRQRLSWRCVQTGMNELANGDLYTTLLEVLIAISTLLTLDLVFFRDE